MSNTNSRLRPPAFVLTGGRTHPVIELDATTVVQARPDPSPPNADGARLGHSWALWNFCHQPRSIANVAEYFDVPLQVAKILVADLVVAEQLDMSPRLDERADLALLEKVLKALTAS